MIHFLLRVCAGKSQTEHPFTRKAQLLCAQHRADAMLSFRERLRVITDYRDELQLKQSLRIQAVIALCHARLVSLFTAR